jgi:superoxide dismutase, Cu-Zn family
MKLRGTCILAITFLVAACTRDKDNTVDGLETQANTRPYDPVVAAPTPTPLSTHLPIPGYGGGTGTYGTTGAGGTGRTGTADGDHRKAEAEFDAAKGYKLKGEAEFHELADGVKVVVEVKDAPPGKRGIHVHEKPDCSDIAGKSMGEHFNPTANPHALPPESPRHLGDLGNIEVMKDGKGRLEATIPRANLKENDAVSLLNRALVIHEDEDTGAQPSGASGKPIACAVIKKD